MSFRSTAAPPVTIVACGKSSDFIVAIVKSAPRPSCSIDALPWSRVMINAWRWSGKNGSSALRI